MIKLFSHRALQYIFVVVFAVPFLIRSAHAIIITTDSKKNEIYISGEFNENDDAKLRSVLETKNQQYKSISLSSPGGNLMAGLRIGELIRKYQLSTNVPSNSICASACGFAWLGGIKKTVEEKGNVGFHASYVIRDGVKTETGPGNALIGAYMNRLGYSDLAIIFATRAAPTQMSWLTSEDGRRLGIEFEYSGVNLPNKKPDILISRSDFEIAMNENPLINAMRYEDPKQYREIVEKLYSEFTKGISEKQLSSIGSSLMYKYSAKKMLTAPSKTILEFVFLQRTVFRKLEKIDPIACSKAHNGEISIVNSMLDTNKAKKIYNDVVRHHPVSVKIMPQEKLKTIYLKAINEAFEENKDSILALSKKYNNDKKMVQVALDTPKNRDDARVSCKILNDLNDILIRDGEYIDVYRYIMTLLLENKVPQIKIR